VVLNKIMNELDKLKISIDSTFWVEKYKPLTIDNLLCNESDKQKFAEIIAKKETGNLLFYGPAGCGKTTTAKMIAKALSNSVLFINASSETGIDTVRHKIEPFCSTKGFGNTHKIVILDEMEMSSESFQTALKAMIESFYGNVRFILTCNVIEKVIEPLRSRMQEFRFGEIDKKEVLKRCFRILETEGVTYEKQNVAEVIKNYGSDMRRIINVLQKLTRDVNGVLTLSQFTTLEQKQLKVLEAIKEGSITNFRKIVTEENVPVEQVAKFVYNKIFDKKLGTKNWVEMLAVMGECMHNLNSTIDREITLTHHVLQVMELMDNS
jgi:DNA polymerase III delta prime subunit